MIPQIDPADYDLPAIEALIIGANLDTDAVSIFGLGENLEQCAGAILIVKGQAHTQYVYKLLVAAALLTPGKPVFLPDPELDPEYSPVPPITETTPTGERLPVHPSPGLRLQRGGA